MTKYIENVNTYLSQMKIKQTFVSLKSGMDKKKLSRILTGAQPVTDSDMDKIAKALGQNIGFFLEGNFVVSNAGNFTGVQVAFYAGTPSKKQAEFAMQILELIENVDTVLSAKGRYVKDIGDCSYGN